VNQCIRQSTWVDIGLFKVCMCAAGILIGLLIPKKHKKAVLAGSAAAFSAACGPLVVRSFLKMSRKDLA